MLVALYVVIRKDIMQSFKSPQMLTKPDCGVRYSKQYFRLIPELG